MSGTDAAGSTSADNKRKQQDPAKFKRKRGTGKGAESNNKFRKGNGQKQKGGKKKPPGTEKAEYIIKDGVRHVKPYVHSFNTHAKGRWFGRSILEVTTTEFGGNDAAYFSNCIKMGFIKVNGEIVAEDYKFKNGDHMTHLTHRHEPPTKGEVKFIGQTDTLFAVSKPSSMPMHPCGAYRFNSLTSILESKDVVENQSKQLLLVHRLDRVTSGVVVLAKNKEAANKVSEEIRFGKTTKQYLARVKGRFAQEDVLSLFRKLEGPALTSVKTLEEDSKFSHLTNKSTQLKYSMEKEKEKEKEEGEENKEAPTEQNSADKIDKEVKKDSGERGTSSSSSQTRADKRKHDTSEEDGEKEGEGEREREGEKKQAPLLADVVSSEIVGYGHSDDYPGMLLLRCPIKVLSFRDGVYCCDPTGKESLSGFRDLGYDPITDSSLILCRPFTGRTHQLRLHLQLLGNSIANDPCYGGQLFFSDEEGKNKAIEALDEMERKGLELVTFVPQLEEMRHFKKAKKARADADGGDENEAKALVLVPSDGSDGGDKEDKGCEDEGPAVVTATAEGEEKGEGKDEKDEKKLPTVPAYMPKVQVKIKSSAAEPANTDSEKEKEKEVEKEVDWDAVLSKSCKFCLGAESVEIENALHCDNVWLHAFRYQGPDFDFQAPLPDWAGDFKGVQEELSSQP